MSTPADTWAQSQTVAAAVLAFLRTVAAAAPSGKDPEGLAIATECIAEFFEVPAHATGAGATLAEHRAALLRLAGELERAGAASAGHSAAVGAGASTGAMPSAELDAAFALYVAKVKTTGYFDGAPEGSAAYAERLELARAKFMAKYGAGAVPATATPVAAAGPSAADRARAEELKEQGNTAVREGAFADAIRAYTAAIELVEDSKYYCNRAAAYSSVDDAAAAERDARAAIRLEPGYVKALRRLGQSLMMQGKYQAAIDEGFEPAAALEPDNDANAAAIAECREHLAGTGSGTGAGTGAGAGGLPAGLPPGLAGLASGLGGMDMGNMDFGALLSNPAIAQMLQNPAIAQMAQQAMANPAMLQSMLGAFGGGAAPPGPR